MQAGRFALLTLVVVACTEESSGPSKGADSTKFDLLAEDACKRFASSVRDGSAGLLTLVEQRDRAKGIYDRGRYSDNTAIRSASRELLAALTTGTSADLEVALESMRAACRL